MIIGLLIIISAFYSYLNARFVKLPGTVGIVSIAIIGSVLTNLLTSWIRMSGKS